MTRTHADYVYSTRSDTLRVRLFQRENGRWDFDVFYPSGKITTFSEEAGDDFRTKREALAEANYQHGPLKPIALKGNIVDEAWRHKHRGSGPSHATRKKPAAQLNREIDAALAGRSPNLAHSTQLANWWRKAAPKEDHACYDTKTKALKAFVDTNYEIVQNYGGADYAVSPSEFDALNHKYSLHGKRAARTIAQAVWAAMPEGKPYCLDRIDLDALNDTSPARESQLTFRLPDYVYEAGLGAEEARYYRSLGAHARICRRCRRPLR